MFNEKYEFPLKTTTYMMSAVLKQFFGEPNSCRGTGLATHALTEVTYVKRYIIINNDSINTHDINDRQ